MATRKPVRRKKAMAASVGLSPSEVRDGRSPDLDRLSADVERDGGSVLGSYRDPFGGTGVLVAALPIDRVEPTPYQRDPSDTHVKRLMGVIERIGRFLDPIIVVRHEGAYWTPNGNHRLQALKRLGAKSIVGLVLPDPEVAFKILALNTEKAHNVREKSLEVIRMARELAQTSSRIESAFAFEFEEPSYLTLGLCYDERPRFSGSAYQPVLRRVEAFLDEPLGRSLEARRRRAERILALDERVSAVVDALKAKGLTSPYLKAFVVARINPVRFSKAESFDFDDVLGKMIASAGRFNVDRVKQEDLAKMGGAPPDAE